MVRRIRCQSRGYRNPLIIISGSTWRPVAHGRYQRASGIFIFQKKAPSGAGSPHHQHHQQSPPRHDLQHVRRARRAVCLSVNYCSKTCQKQDWTNKHRRECFKPKLSNGLTQAGHVRAYLRERPLALLDVNYMTGTMHLLAPHRAFVMSVFDDNFDMLRECIESKHGPADFICIRRAELDSVPGRVYAV